MQKIEPHFYRQKTETVAKSLLGMLLVKKYKNDFQIGRIVETEAYLGTHDLACHTSKGFTKRNKTMFGEPGHAYVYLIYGIHHCFNIVTEPAGHGAAVLIRAIEPVKNIALRTNGPGLLCKSLDIDRTYDGKDLTGDEIFCIYPDSKEEFSIIAKPRIGVQYAKEWALKPLRFYIENNPFVSRL